MPDKALQPDGKLDRLYLERDHIAIKLSLAKDAGIPDRKAIRRLERTLADIEAEIKRYRRADA